MEGVSFSYTKGIILLWEIIDVTITQQLVVMTSTGGCQPPEKGVFQVDHEKDAFIGVSKATSPVFIDVFSKDRGFDGMFILGKVGTGRIIYQNPIYYEYALMKHIIKNHLNNNGWLKRHRKPMVRKGHPLYKECRNCKGINMVPRLIIVDQEQEYKQLSGMFESDIVTL